ncbi:MAG: hypothetical protein RIR18_579 [Pseudomonadota bacterium]
MPINTAPVANNDTSTITDLSAASSITGATLLANDTDANSDTLSILSVSSTSSLGSALSLSAGIITYTPGTSVKALAAGVAGTDTFTYVVADPSNAQTTGTVTLSITGINDTPVLNIATPNQLLYRATAFSYTLPVGAFTDPDTGDSLTYTATLSDGTSLPEWLAFDPSCVSFSGTPPADISTSLAIKITATDKLNAHISTEFSIVPTNSAPFLAIPIDAQSATEKSPYSFTLPADSFTEPDSAIGDSITYSATLSSGTALPSWLSFNSATQILSGTPPSGSTGALSLRITATDTHQSSTSCDFSLTIENINDAPTLANKLGTVTWNALEAGEYTIPANTFADIDDGDSLALSATNLLLKSLPDWLSFDGTTFTGTPTNANAGITSVLIIATDQSGAEVSGFLKLKVNYTNQAPIVSNSIPDQSSTEGKKFSFSVPKKTFSDPDKGDVLTLSADNLPEWLSFNTSKGVFSGIPDAHASGDHLITVTATDKKGLTTETTFTLTVTDNPIITGTNYADWLEGDEGNNSIYGKNGRDTLTGGDGEDWFVFDTAPNLKNTDTILDFTPGVDKIVLSKKLFKLPPPAADDIASAFALGYFAEKPTDRLLYDPESGIVLYDPDGSGVKLAAYICVLVGLPELSAADLILR